MRGVVLDESPLLPSGRSRLDPTSPILCVFDGPTLTVRPLVRNLSYIANCVHITTRPRMRYPRRGQSLSEYGVIISLIVVLMIGSVVVVGGAVSGTFSGIADAIAGGTVGPAPTETAPPAHVAGTPNPVSVAPAIRSTLYSGNYLLATVSIDANALGGDETTRVYAWIGPDGLASVEASISPSLSCSSLPSSVSVTVSDGSGQLATHALQIAGCPTTLAVTSSIASGPTYDAGRTTAAITLLATISNGKAPFSYAWTGPAGWTSTDVAPSPTFACGALPGSVGVTITDANNQTITASPIAMVACPQPTGPYVYALLSNKTVQITRSGGNTSGDWTLSTTLPASGIWTSVAVVPGTNGLTAYAAGSAGSFARTTNGGATWTPLASPAGAAGNIIHLIPIDTNVIWAADSSRIYRTINAGTSWASSNNAIGGSINSMAAPDAQTAFYASTLGNNLAGTADGGTTWTTKNGSFPDVVGASNPNFIAVHGGNSGNNGLKCAAGWAAAWRTPNCSGNYYDSISEIVVAPDSKHVYLITNNKSSRITADITVTDPVWTTAPLKYLGVSADTDLDAWAWTATTVYQTTNGGTNFTSRLVPSGATVLGVSAVSS